MKIKAKSTKRDDLKTYLIEEQQRLIVDISKKNISGRERAGYGNHIADDATEVFEQTKLLALRRGLEKRLTRVEAALRKMEVGAYGLCEICGVPIDPARLKVIPSACLCLSCQTHAEVRKGNNWRKRR